MKQNEKVAEQKATVATLDKVWLSNHEAQKYLGIGPDFFKRLRSKGELRFFKVGTSVFYRKQDIDRLIERGRVTI